MTATQTKLRRGTATQCDAMTPAEGELVVDLTNDRPRLGDGLLAGGFSIPNAFDVQNGAFNTVTATGTNTIAVTLAPVPLGYGSTTTVIFKQATTNTGAATLNVNTLGAKALVKVSGGAIVPLIAGDLVAGAYYTARYDGTQFILAAAGGGGVASVSGMDGIVVTPTTGAPVASIDTNNPGGVGTTIFAAYNSGTSLANGATTAGTNLALIQIGTGVSAATGINVSLTTGTWRNITGVTLAGATGGGSGRVVVGTFIRTA